MPHAQYPNGEIVREFKYRYHEPKLVEVQKPVRLMEPASYSYGGDTGGAGGGYGGHGGRVGGGYWRWRRENENRRFMWYVIIIVLLVASFLMLAALAMSSSSVSPTVI
jgi:hypothetical protein